MLASQFLANLLQKSVQLQTISFNMNFREQLLQQIRLKRVEVWDFLLTWTVMKFDREHHETDVFSLISSQ